MKGAAIISVSSAVLGNITTYMPTLQESAWVVAIISGCFSIAKTCVDITKNKK